MCVVARAVARAMHVFTFPRGRETWMHATFPAQKHTHYHHHPHRPRATSSGIIQGRPISYRATHTHTQHHTLKIVMPVSPHSKAAVLPLRPSLLALVVLLIPPRYHMLCVAKNSKLLLACRSSGALRASSPTKGRPASLALRALRGRGTYIA